MSTRSGHVRAGVCICAYSHTSLPFVNLNCDADHFPHRAAWSMQPSWGNSQNPSSGQQSQPKFRATNRSKTDCAVDLASLGGLSFGTEVCKNGPEMYLLAFRTSQAIEIRHSMAMGTAFALFLAIIPIWMLDTRCTLFKLNMSTTFSWFLSRRFRNFSFPSITYFSRDAAICRAKLFHRILAQIFKTFLIFFLVQLEHNELHW